MAPLLKPTECSLLVLDSAGEPGPKDQDADVVAGRNRILQAAVLCGIPSFLAVREPEVAEQDSVSKPAHQQNLQSAKARKPLGRNSSRVGTCPREPDVTADLRLLAGGLGVGSKSPRSHQSNQ